MDADLRLVADANITVNMKVVKQRGWSDLQDLNDTFLVVPCVKGLKHFAVFAAAKFSNQLVVIQFTAATTHIQQWKPSY